MSRWGPILKMIHCSPTHLQLLEVVNTSILPHEDDNVMWMLQIQR